jgi:hypothetical protein
LTIAPVTAHTPNWVSPSRANISGVSRNDRKVPRSTLEDWASVFRNSTVRRLVGGGTGGDIAGHTAEGPGS